MMDSGGIYYYSFDSSGDAIFRLHRGSLSEIGMFDLKKQLFYLVFLEPV
jgi:hypothetical protein